MGRPSKLTRTVQARIVEALEGGNTRRAAAAAAGVDASTMRRWMKRGEDGDTDFRAFCAAVKKAESVCQKRCLDLINSAAAAGKWQAAAWVLERRWPESWARRAGEKVTPDEEIVVNLVPEPFDVDKASKLLDQARRDLKRQGFKVVD